jgi:hypothetical protein
LVHEARVVVGPMPGVTRDSVPVDWSLLDPLQPDAPPRRLRLVDTAGIRKFTMERQPRGGGTRTLWAASAGGGEDWATSSVVRGGVGLAGRALQRHAVGGGAGAALELQLEQEAVDASLRALGMASVVRKKTKHKCPVAAAGGRFVPMLTHLQAKFQSYLRPLVTQSISV